MTLSANRGDVDYERLAKVSIEGVEAAVDESSDGVLENDDGSMSFSAGYNNVNGYVVKWMGIDPGDDGSFSVTSMWDSERGTQPSIRAEAATTTRATPWQPSNSSNALRRGPVLRLPFRC